MKMFILPAFLATNFSERPMKTEEIPLIVYDYNAQESVSVAKNVLNLKESFRKFFVIRLREMEKCIFVLKIFEENLAI